MMGTATDRVSGREDLLKQRVTSGYGEPAHTPEVDAQDYTDTSDGTVYHWYAGSWHEEGA